MNSADEEKSIAGAPSVKRRRLTRLLGVLRNVVPVLATIVIGAMLLAAMYFTLLDLQWVIFLSGVLFAALVALASRASHAEWTIARRNAQLAQFKERLAQETAAHKHAEFAYHASVEKMQLLSNSIPIAVVYTDAGEHVRFHNRAFRDWIEISDPLIDGHRFGDVLGQDLYAQMQPAIVKALSDTLPAEERVQTIAYEIGSHLQLTFIPHLDGLGKVVGLLVLMNEEEKEIPWSSPNEAGPVEAAANEEGPGWPISVADADGQTLYLHSITEQLTGWDNPQARLKQALENNEFRLFCQQFVDLKNAGGDCPYYEILMRLQEEEANLTPPGAFIPVAEHYNMTTALDCWVVRNVIDWHRARRRDGPLWQTSMYSLNLFPSTMGDAGFGDYVHKLLDASGVPSQVLCFEVAEDEAVRHKDVAARFVANLRQIGCRVALGGFGGGTGGTVSFDILKRMPVDFLKIHDGMAHDIEDNPVKRARVKAISRVCSVIGVHTVAQFVESAIVLRILTECGVDYAQGFGIARPQSIDTLK
jgi:EAL domain-containing protein (putative c-di-GMP-specific phosphodiesterase class I)/PAS domain-containing protein